MKKVVAALIAIGMDMSHNIMPEAFFTIFYGFNIYVINMCVHFSDLSIGNRQTEGLFSPRQLIPEPPPCGEFLVIRKQVLHYR